MYLGLGRKDLRLPEYDYSQEGLYYITICTNNREYLFGNIVNDKMKLNDAGKMVKQCWKEIPKHYLSVILDIFIIMPNHIHGIIEIIDVDNTSPIVGAPLVGALENDSNTKNTNDRAGTRPAPTKTIGDIIGGFKSMTTNEYIRNVENNNWLPFDGKLWQRNYYEHIVRHENDLQQIRQYIIDNPMMWERDRNNKDNPNSQYTSCK